MRGQPWLRALLAALVFALAGVPLWQLTRTARGGAPVSNPGTGARAPELAVTPAPAVAVMPMHVEVMWSAPPGEWTLRYLGAVVLAGRGAEQTVRGVWQVALPREGADLALQAAASPMGEGRDAATPGPRAVRVLVTWPDGRVAADRTFWMTAESGDTLGEIITVPSAGEANGTP